MEHLLGKEDFVNLETAKLLKEKGFNWQCRNFYREENGEWFKRTTYEHNYFNTDVPRWENCYACPTLQMALKWIREEKHFYIQIMLDSLACGGHLGYYIVIQDINSDFEEVSPAVNDNDDVFFSTHEAATEAAIKYCLENLVK